MLIRLGHPLRIYNVEELDTTRGGYSAGSYQEFIKRYRLSKRAVASGSDLRKLTGREMLGVFLYQWGRHYADTKRLTAR